MDTRKLFFSRKRSALSVETQIHIISSVIYFRRPNTTDSSTGRTTQDESDVLNSEFNSLTREAKQLDEKDKVTVRNRLNNVQIKLSDVQKRLAECNAEKNCFSVSLQALERAKIHLTAKTLHF